MARKMLFCGLLIALCSLAQAQQTLPYIPKSGTCWTDKTANGWLGVNQFAKWGPNSNNTCINQQSASYGHTSNTDVVSCDNTQDPPVAYHQYTLRGGFLCECANWHYILLSVNTDNNCNAALGSGFRTWQNCG